MASQIASDQFNQAVQQRVRLAEAFRVIGVLARARAPKFEGFQQLAGIGSIGFRHEAGVTPAFHDIQARAGLVRHRRPAKTRTGRPVKFDGKIMRDEKIGDRFATQGQGARSAAGRQIGLKENARQHGFRMPPGCSPRPGRNRMVLSVTHLAEPGGFGRRQDEMIHPIQEERAGFRAQPFGELRDPRVMLLTRVQLGQDVILCLITQRPIESLFLVHPLPLEVGVGGLPNWMPWASGNSVE
jgi:hypothetical protein